MLTDLPSEAAIELTSTCPLDCVFCTRRQTRGAGRHLDWDLYRSVIAQLGRPRRIYLNGVGESVHYPRVGEAVRLAKSTGAAVELTSSLGTASDRVLGALVDSGLDALHVSLHTLDPQRCREIYRGGSAAVTFRAAIDRFLERRAQAGASTAVDFAFVALACNLPDLPALADYADAIGVRFVNVLAVMQPPERRRLFPFEIQDNFLSADFRRVLREVVARARERHPRVEIHTPELGDTVTLDAEPREYPWPLPPGARIADCYESPFTRMTILANGDVPACCEDGMEVVGSVAGQGLAEIWRGRRLNAFRRRHESGRHPTCRICPGKRAYLPAGVQPPASGVASGRARFIQR